MFDVLLIKKIFFSRCSVYDFKVENNLNKINYRNKLFIFNVMIMWFWFVRILIVLVCVMLLKFILLMFVIWFLIFIFWFFVCFFGLRLEYIGRRIWDFNLGIVVLWNWIIFCGFKKLNYVLWLKKVELCIVVWRNLIVFYGLW